MPENKEPQVGEEVNFKDEDDEWQTTTITAVHDQDGNKWVVDTEVGDTMTVEWNVEDESWDDVEAV